MEDRGDSDSVLEELRRLARQIDDLSRRVGDLEAGQSPKPAPQPPPVVPPPPPIMPPPSVPPIASAPSGPAVMPGPVRAAAPRPPSPSFDWEQLIGGKWALWLGSIASFLAVAFFLAYAWQYLGPAGRLMVGYGAGLLFLAAGSLASGRGEKWFGEGLTGAGLAILYLSTWAGVERYGVFSRDFAFLLMAVITAAGVAMAIRCESQSLCVLSTLGGFLTPAILTAGGRGASEAFPLLAYVAVLNAGVLAVSLFKRWRGVVILSFAGTVLLTGGWAMESYSEPHRWVVFGFFTLYILMFLGAACFYSLIRKQPTADEDLALVFADAFVYLAAGLAVLHGGLGNSPGVFPAALGVFLLLMAWDTLSAAPGNAPLRRALLGLALTSLTVAIPVQMRQGWVAIAWSVEAAVLAALAQWLRSRTLQWAGRVVWALAAAAILAVLGSVEPSRRAVLVNERALPLLVGVLCSAWMCVAGRARGEAGRDESVDVYGVAAALGGAALAAMETWYALSWREYLTPAALTARTLYATACMWAVYSVVVWRAGAALGSAAVRFCGIMLAVLAGIIPAMQTTIGYGSQWQPFWNARWLSFVIAALALALLAWMVRKEQESMTKAESDFVGPLCALVALVLLWAVTVELYAGVRIWGLAQPLPPDVAGVLAVTMFWAVAAPVAVSLGIAWKLPALQAAGWFAGFAALVLALTTAAAGTGPALQPVANIRFVTFLVLAGSALAMARICGAGQDGEKPAAGAATAIGLLAAVVLLWGLTQETWEFFRFTRDRWGEHWRLAAQMGVSLVWTLSGVLLLIGGVMRRYRPVRLFALVLLGLTVVKVFLADLGFLDTPYRILSFAGLGVALIGISWLYSRYEIGGGEEPPGP